MFEKITARFHITTPMFIGDAHQQASGISPAAVKGALRFWWRALNWSQLRSVEGATDETALQKLHAKEAKLFGSAADQVAGQSSFRILVSQDKLSDTKKGTVHQQFQRYAAARYLGYGLMEAFASRKKDTQAGQLVRSCINENQAFTITLISHSSINSSLMEAMIAFGLLGGMGSRARHGMGSVTLESISKGQQVIWEAPADLDGYKKRLRGIVGQITAGLPPFSAFSDSTRIDSLLSAANPYDVLADFGNRMLLYRSWGKNGKVLNQPSEKRFRSDHDWSKFDRPNNNFHPRRVVFGLPHNYGSKVDKSVKPANHDRRSSPLIFHVHKVGNKYYGVSVLLKADFLPIDEKINAGGKAVPANIEWSVLYDFLDGKDKKGDLRFAQREQLL